MRRLAMLLALMVMTVGLVAGVALAESVKCPGSGRCTGTSGNDTMRGGNGDVTGWSAAVEKTACTVATARTWSRVSGPPT